MAGGWRGQLTSLVRTAVREGAKVATRELRRRSAPDRPTPTPTPPASKPAGSGAGVRLEYTPRDDGQPDPGEIVWAWVPFEEGDGRGKDRPVLVVGHEGAELVAFMLTSKDHDRDADDEARHGRHWVDIGSGAWDRQGRPSEVRVDRVLRLDPAGVRREGATLDRERFERVADEARRVLGW